MPTISTSSPTLIMPRSMRPVHHRAAAGDREHVLDRHQERLVLRALRLRDVVIHRLHQLEDGVIAELPVLVLQRHQRRAPDHRNLVAGETVLGQKLPHFELDQLEQLGIVHHVHFVEEHHERGHADLARQQDVLAGLRHRAVGRRNHQDRAVHLRRAGDHVLHVVGMARAVDVRVVAACRSRTRRARSQIVMPRAFSSGALSIWS